MIVTVASYKGGVAKTTTAVHLAAFLQGQASTLLLDGDGTRNATAWSERGKASFPFRVAPIQAAAKLAREFTHTVIDTGQRPSADDLKAAAEGSDLIVVPAVPSALDSDGLGQTVRALEKIGARYKVLLTRVAPDAAKAAADLRKLLCEIGTPVFVAEIPRLKAFERAADAGQIVSQLTALEDRNAARAWAAYAAAGKELLG